MAKPLDEAALVHGHVDLGGLRLHYVEAGDGPLVLLLHGFPEFWYSWRHQIPALVASGMRVVAVDLRGCNLSDKPAGVDAYRLSRLADDIAAVVEHFGDRPATLVGHDFGGVIAWATAMRHPARVKRLAVLNAPHPAALPRALLGVKRPLRTLSVIALQLGVLPELAVRACDHALVRALLREGTMREGAFAEAEVARVIEALEHPGALTAALNTLRAFGRTAVGDGTPPTRIEVPVLVIWGEGDRLFRRELAEPRPAWASRVRVERIRNAGHFVHVDAPARVNTLLAGFTGMSDSFAGYFSA